MGRKLNTNDAVMKGAQDLLKREECVLDMEQRENTNDAALKDVQTNPNKEEYARDMEHTATPTQLASVWVRI